MNTIRTSIAITAVVVSTSAAAFASPQILDGIYFGGREYFTYQSPMSEYWHFGDGDPPKGKRRPPDFEFTSANNWIGYTATWEIRNSRLWLNEIGGKLGGKKVKNEAILPKFKFPVEASWFTGKIYMPVGDLNEDRNEYEAVIVFEIEKGQVKAMKFLPSARLEYSLNGLGSN